MNDKLFNFLNHKVNLESMQKERKFAIDRLEAIAYKAKVLVDSSDFCEFKEDFEVQLAASIDLLINYDEKDPVLYKLGVRDILIRIKVLRDFINNVTLKSKMMKGDN